MIKSLRDIWQSEFFKNIATLISGTTIAQAFSVIVYIFLGRIYQDEDFGVFGLYMNILNIVIIFSTAKYDMAILLPEKNKDAASLLGLSASISIFFSAFLMLLIVPLHNQMGQWLGSEEISDWLYFIPLSTLMVGWFTSLRNFSNREKRYKLIAGANIGQSMTNSLIKLGLGLTIAGASGLIYGALVGQLVGLSIFIGYQLYSNREKFKAVKLADMKRVAREYSLFPRFNMWQGLINNVSGAFPVILFSSYFSTAIAGIFTFGYMVLYRPVNLVAGSFYQVLYQRFVEKMHKGQPLLPEIYLLLRRTTLILILPFVLTGIFAPEIFGFIFGDEWIESGRYARFMLPWIFTIALVMPLSFIPDIYKRQRGAMILDSFRLGFRLLGLIIGILNEDVYLAVALYSGFSAMMASVSLFWYIWLVKQNTE